MVQEAMKVGEPQEGGGPRPYRRAGVEGCRRPWKYGEPSERGGPRQYRMAEVEGCRRPWK